MLQANLDLLNLHEPLPKITLRSKISPKPIYESMASTKTHMGQPNNYLPCILNHLNYLPLTHIGLTCYEVLWDFNLCCPTELPLDPFTKSFCSITCWSWYISKPGIDIYGNQIISPSHMVMLSNHLLLTCGGVDVYLSLKLIYTQTKSSPLHTCWCFPNYLSPHIYWSKVLREL